jgi:uncharacterized protein (DUF302 family)
MADTGLVTIESAHPFAATLERLQAQLRAKGVTVFAQFDHAAGAAEAGLALRPTTVVVFGNPAAGTRLMQESQLAGIDLPLRVLVWQDADGQVRLSWNDTGWIAARHGLGAASAPVVSAMAGMVEAVARQAAA